MQTERPKVFVAGDFVRGPRTIVEAIAQGKEAAISIERLLKGDDLWYERAEGQALRASVRARLVARREAGACRDADPARGAAQKIPGKRPAASRRKRLLAEAGRCLDCGRPVGLRTCWFCLPCEIECPEEALYVEIPYLLR